jgi:hypothetical protein
VLLLEVKNQTYEEAMKEMMERIKGGQRLRAVPKTDTVSCIADFMLLPAGHVVM